MNAKQGQHHEISLSFEEIATMLEIELAPGERVVFCKIDIVPGPEFTYRFRINTERST